MATVIGLTEKDKEIIALRKLLKPGDTAYTILRHRASSGMSRVIDLVIIRDNDVVNIGYATAKVLGYSLDTKYEGLRVRGAGMDMGYHLVYSLGRVLFPDGFKVTSKYGRNGDTSGWDKDGGYALNHRWL